MSGRVIGYTRCSTQAQAASGLGLRAQRDAILARYPAATVVEEVASGKGLRGRPKLRDVIAGMGRNEALVVAKTDRLARNLRDLLAITAAAVDGGWSLVLLDLGVDTGTAAGKMALSMFGAVAEFERDRNIERVVDAVDARDPALGGRRVRIRELWAEGRSKAEVARLVGCHRNTVIRELARLTG